LRGLEIEEVEEVLKSLGRFRKLRGLGFRSLECNHSTIQQFKQFNNSAKNSIR